MPRPLRAAPGLLLLLLACATAPVAPGPAAVAPPAAPAEPAPPVAPVHPERTELHGQVRVDDYAWLKKKGTPEVEAYLQAENAYTDAWMKRTEGLRQTLYQEMLGRVQEDDTSAPYPDHGYEYYARTVAGQQYAIQCRRKLPGGPEQVLLDLNELGKGLKFIASGPRAISDDGRLMAFSLDRTGFRQFELQVKDLASGAVLPETFSRVRSVAWAADGKTLFYTQENDAKRSSKLLRHRLGTPVAADALVYEEKDERFGVYVGRTRDRAWLDLSIRSHTTSEQRLLDARKPEGAFAVVLPRVQDVEYEATPHGDVLLVVTNDTSRTKRLVQVPRAAPQDRKRWVELVPARPDVSLEEVEVFKDFYVLAERQGGLTRLRSVDFKSRKETAFSFPEEDYTVFPAFNAEDETREFRFAYSSMVTPFTVFARDVKTGALRTVKQDPVPTYDPARYETRRLFAPAADGTLIPLSVAFKKGLPRDGSAAAYLRGYGSYGASIDAFFQPNLVSLLDRGVVVAWAHVRGGGEYGKPWHDAGRMLNKRNTFGDFIAAAEYLVKEGWTSKGRLAINGGSAGGLLMGVVLNERPDLFRAALVEVPFVDVVNTMLDESLPLTVEEFEEWGNPKVKAEYDYLMSYSPYDNVKPQAYPSMLVRSSYNDSQVLYHEPAKWVARLRKLGTGQQPLLLKMELDPAGHGGRSGRYDRLKDAAYFNAFVLHELGL